MSACVFSVIRIMSDSLRTHKMPWTACIVLLMLARRFFISDTSDMAKRIPDVMLHVLGVDCPMLWFVICVCPKMFPTLKNLEHRIVILCHETSDFSEVPRRPITEIYFPFASHTFSIYFPYTFHILRCLKQSTRAVCFPGPGCHCWGEEPGSLL